MNTIVKDEARQYSRQQELDEVAVHYIRRALQGENTMREQLEFQSYCRGQESTQGMQTMQGCSNAPPGPLRYCPPLFSARVTGSLGPLTTRVATATDRTKTSDVPSLRTMHCPSARSRLGFLRPPSWVPTASWGVETNLVTLSTKSGWGGWTREIPRRPGFPGRRQDPGCQ